jgi:hypothetical protein
VQGSDLDAASADVPRAGVGQQRALADIPDLHVSRSRVDMHVSARAFDLDVTRSGVQQQAASGGRSTDIGRARVHREVAVYVGHGDLPDGQVQEKRVAPGHLDVEVRVRLQPGSRLADPHLAASLSPLPVEGAVIPHPDLRFTRRGVHDLVSRIDHAESVDPADTVALQGDLSGADLEAVGVSSAPSHTDGDGGSSPGHADGTGQIPHGGPVTL